MAVGFLCANSDAIPAIDRLTVNCGGPFELCGYVERTSNKPVIPWRYEVAKEFNEDMAAVRIEGRYGYIDRSGTVVIAPRFAAAGPFENGRAEVRIGRAAGIINRSGRLVVPAQFDRILPFGLGAYLARDLARGSTQFEPDLSGWNGTNLYPADAFGVWHPRKGWLTKKNLEISYFDTPGRGLIWAAQPDESGEEIWGLMRADGRWQVRPRFAHVQWIMGDRAVVYEVDRNAKDRTRRTRWGAVDKNGRVAVPLTFDSLSYWRGGYGMARKGASANGMDASPIAIVRPDGSLLGNRYFDKVEIAEEGTLPRVRVDGQWFSISPAAKLLPDQAAERVLLRCPSGLTLRQRGERVEISHPASAQSIGVFDKTYRDARDCNQPLTVKSGEKWRFVTQTGVLLGGERGFDNTYGFSRDHAAVEVDGKWGIIDGRGAFTVTPQFAELSPGIGGFQVRGGPKTYRIDATGRRLPELPKPAARDLLECPGGLTLFDKAGSWGIRRPDGTVVVAAQYRAIQCFREGVAWAAAAGARQWCPVGPDGRYRKLPECRTKVYPMTMHHEHPEPLSEDPYESSVLWTRAYLDHASGRRASSPRMLSDFGGGSTSPPTQLITNPPAEPISYRGSLPLVAGLLTAVGIASFAAFRLRRRKRIA